VAAEGAGAAGDGVAILPPWSLRPLVAWGDLDPIDADGLPTQPLQRFRRLFVCAEPGAEGDLAALQRRFGPGVLLGREGPVSVWRFDLPPALRFDATAELAQAEVAVTQRGGSLADADARPCAAIPGGASCGTERWQRVTRQWLLVSENGARAVWAHPPVGGQQLVLKWRDVPAGDVVVRAGFVRKDSAQAERPRAPVRVHVWIDGVERGVVERRPRAGRFGGDGARVFESTVVPASSAGRGDSGARWQSLALVIETDDNTGAHFAVDAFVVDPAQVRP
jgi:hypothetical protein